MIKAKIVGMDNTRYGGIEFILECKICGEKIELETKAFEKLQCKCSEYFFDFYTGNKIKNDKEEEYLQSPGLFNQQ